MHRVRFQGLAPGLHQHDYSAGEVLSEGDRPDDGEHRHDVGGEAPAQHPPHRPSDERCAAGEQCDQEHPIGESRRPEGKTRYQPGKKPGGGQRRHRVTRQSQPFDQNGLKPGEPNRVIRR